MSEHHYNTGIILILGLEMKQAAAPDVGSGRKLIHVNYLRSITFR